MITDTNNDNKIAPVSIIIIELLYHVITGSSVHNERIERLWRDGDGHDG